MPYVFKQPFRLDEYTQTLKPDEMPGSSNPTLTTGVGKHEK